MLLNLTIQVNQTGNGVTATVTGLNQVAAAANAAGNAGASGASQIAKGVREAYYEVLALRAAYEGLKSVAEHTVLGGVEFNMELQKGQLLTAALISNYQKVYDAQGNLVTGAGKFNVAMTIATDLQGEMLVASLKYGIAYESIATTAQTVLATSHGQVKDAQQLVELSVKLSKVGTLTGLQPFQVMRDVRDMMTVGRPTELSMMLGITPQDLKQARESGNVVDFLNKKLNVYMLTAERFRGTVPGALMALKAAWEQAMGQGTAGQMGEVNRLLLDLFNRIVTVDKAGHAAFNPALVRGVEDFATALVHAADNMSRLVGLVPKILEFLAHLSEPDLQKSLFALSGAALGFAVGGVGGAVKGGALGYGFGAASQAAGSYSWVEKYFEWTRHMGGFDTAQAQPNSLTGASDLQKINAIMQGLRKTQYGDARSPFKALGLSKDLDIANVYAGSSAPDATKIKALVDLLVTGKLSADAFAAALKKLPAAGAPGKAHFGPGGPLPLSEEQQQAIKAAEARIQQMKDESDIAKNEIALQQQKLVILQQQGTAEGVIRAMVGLTAADAKTTIEQLRSVYEISTQLAQAEATEQKKKDEAKKEFDKSSSEAKNNKNLIEPKREEVIAQARKTQRDKDDAAAAEYAVALEQIRQKSADNERQITSDFLAEIAKRNADRFGATKAAIEAQIQYEGAYVIAQGEMYTNLARDGAASLQQAVIGVFTGHGITSAIDQFAGYLQQSIAKYGTAGVERFLTTLASRANGEQFYDAKTGTYRYPTSAEITTAQRQMAGIQSAAALFQLYQNGQAGVGSRTNGISGAVQGAMIGTAISPVIGTIIGMVVGGIAGALTGGGSKTRFSVSVQGGHMVVSGVGNFAQSDIDSAMRQINDTLSSSVSSVWNIIGAFPTAIAQQLALPSAGSLFTNGQTFNDPIEHVRTTAISIFKKSLAGGMNADALKHFMEVELPTLVLNAVMPEIQDGLQRLGVNTSKIADIEATARGMDPTKAFSFIESYITEFVRMRDNVAKLQMSPSARLADARGPSVPDQLSTFNEQLRFLTNGFAQLTTEEQVNRAKQINDILVQRNQLEAQYLVEIADTRRAIVTSFNQILGSVRLSEEGKGSNPYDQQYADLNAQRSRVALSLNGTSGRHGVAGAKTPQEVQQIADSYSQLTQQMIDLAVNLRDQFKSVLDDFAGIDKKNKAYADSKLTAQQQVDKLAGNIIGIADNFSQFANDDKLAKSREMIDLAGQYFDLVHQEQDSLLAEAKNVHQSIQEQIFGVQLDQKSNDPQSQINMLLARNRDLYNQLGGATNAQDIDRIQNEIRQNAEQVYTLSGKTPDAAQKFLQTLSDLDTQVSARTKQLGIDLGKSLDPVTAALQGTVTTVTGTIGDLNTTIVGLQNDLTTFLQQTQKKLDTFTDAVGKGDQDLFKIINPIFLAFGAQVDTAGTKIGDISAPGGNLDRFRDKLDSATSSLARFAEIGYSNTRFGTGTQSTSAGSSSAGAVVIQFQPKISVTAQGSIAPFVSFVTQIADDRIDRRAVAVAQRRRGAL